MSQPLRIVYLTAGAAGMYCGSCMHDNALAKAMRQAGDDVLLQPLYTPIRTDETDIAERALFFGGIHVFLLQKAPWLARLPRWTRSWLDRPGFVRWASRRAVRTDPALLGELTLSMLRGEHGRQAEEVHRLVGWLADTARPDAILLTNLLIGGAIPTIRQRLPNTRIIVTLQGDDLFLDHLPSEMRANAVDLCGKLARHVDCFITHSRFYRDKMAATLGIDTSRFEVHPLSIDLAAFAPEPVIPEPDSPEPDSAVDPPPASSGQPTTGRHHGRPLVRRTSDEIRIGFLARIAPEKGLHLLAEAFQRIARRPGHETISLHAAGWLGPQHRSYLAEIQAKLTRAGLADRFVYHGSPDLAGKVRLLRSWDVFSVPAPYEDPKGLFLLESLAAGIPVVQPDHGAFSELIADLGGGILVPPGDVDALAEALSELATDGQSRAQLMLNVPGPLYQRHSIEQAAARLRQTCLGQPTQSGPLVSQ